MNANDYTLFDILALTLLYGLMVCAGILLLPKEVMCCIAGVVTVILALACIGKMEREMNGDSDEMSLVCAVLICYTIALGFVSSLTWVEATSYSIGLLVVFALSKSLFWAWRKPAK